MATQPHLSPEKYIRTKARNLPLFECLLNDNWEEEGIASIFVSRKHSNGNITYGSYLVDTWCLGLKDSFWEFNTDPDEWNKIKSALREQGLNPQVVDYNLVHNIIYGGIAFAGEYNLSPYKEFALSQYVLEEDDERIPLMDLEFGLDGIPHLVVFPADSKAKAALKHLQANFSDDEFTFAMGDYDGKNIPEDDTEDDEFNDALDELGNSEEVMHMRELFSQLKPHEEKIEALFCRHFGLAVVNFSRPDFDNLPFIVGELPFSYGEEADTVLAEILDRLDEKDYDDVGEFIDEIKEVAEKFPAVPAFWFIAADVYCDNEHYEEALNLLKEKSAVFPHVFYFIVKQMLILTDMGGRDDAVVDLGRQNYVRLPQFAVNGELDKDELVDFFVTLCGAISPEQMIADADTCLAWLKYLDGPHILIETQQMCLLSIKYQKLLDKGLIEPLV